MNRKNLALALAAAALVSSPAFAADVANWTPDAPAAQAFPALVQGTDSGKTRAEVRAEARRVQQASFGHWTPDASAADAFPALRQPVAAGQSREAVRAEVLGARAARHLSVREGA